MLFADGYKYIRGAAGREQLYDLWSDPRERHDLSAVGTASVALRTRFDQIAAGMDHGANRALGVGDLPKDTLEQLRALGYVR